jgi:two-component system chemotaxis response regulator CheB
MSAHRTASGPAPFEPGTGQARHLASHGRRRDIVVIAASAGGVLALLEIVAALPEDFEPPIAIVLHRTPKPPRMLDKLLAKRCRLRVVEAATGDRLAPRTIFIAPPDGHLSPQPDRTFVVEDGRRIDHVRSSANPLFESAADVFGAGVVAIVLSGSGRNGARGVASIKARGGTVIVQNQATSAFFEMPAAALQTGAVDFVLPVDHIASALAVVCTPAASRPSTATG